MKTLILVAFMALTLIATCEAASGFSYFFTPRRGPIAKTPAHHGYKHIVRPYHRHYHTQPKKIHTFVQPYQHHYHAQPQKIHTYVQPEKTHVYDAPKITHTYSQPKKTYGYTLVDDSSEEDDYDQRIKNIQKSSEENDYDQKN